MSSPTPQGLRDGQEQLCSHRYFSSICSDPDCSLNPELPGHISCSHLLSEEVGFLLFRAAGGFLEVDLQVVLGLKQPRELLSQFRVCLCFVTEEPNTGHGSPDLVLEEKNKSLGQRTSGIWEGGVWGNSDLTPTHDACVPAPIPISSCIALGISPP